VESNNQYGSQALHGVHHPGRRLDISGSYEDNEWLSDSKYSTRKLRRQTHPPEDSSAIDIRDIENFSYDLIVPSSHVRRLYPTPASRQSASESEDFSNCSTTGDTLRSLARATFLNHRHTPHTRGQKHRTEFKNPNDKTDMTFQDDELKPPAKLKYRHRQTGVTMVFDDVGTSDEWVSLDDSVTSSDARMYDTVSQRVLGEPRRTSRAVSERRETLPVSEGVTSIDVGGRNSRTYGGAGNQDVNDSHLNSDRQGAAVGSCASSLSNVSVLQKQFGLTIPSHVTTLRQSHDKRFLSNNDSGMDLKDESCLAENCSPPPTPSDVGSTRSNEEDHPDVLSATRNCAGTVCTSANHLPQAKLRKKRRKNKCLNKSVFLPPLVENKRTAWVKERITTRAFVFSYFTLLGGHRNHQ